MTTPSPLADRPDQDPASRADRTSLSEAPLPVRLKRVSRAWGLLLVALSVLALGLRGYVLQRLHDGVLTAWQVTWLTLPLAAATAIVVYRWRTRLPTSFAGFVGIVLGTLAASVVTGLSSGQRVADSLFHYDAQCLLHDTCTTTTGNSVTLILRIMGSYLQIYGTTGFFSAIAVGIFAGYAVAVLMGKDRRTPPPVPAGESV
jgi:hypothetical protein